MKVFKKFRFSHSSAKELKVHIKPHSSKVITLSEHEI